MDLIGDGPDTFRINRIEQIEQIPQIKLTHDDIHSSCSICISNFTKNEIILILPCIHKFHRLCIQTWLAKNNTCPTCRLKVFDDMDTVSNTDDSSDDEIEGPDLSFEMTQPNYHSVPLDLEISDGSIMSDLSDQSDASDPHELNVPWDDIFSDAYGMDAESTIDVSVAVSVESSDDETDSMNESQITVSSSSTDSDRSDMSQMELPVSSDESSADGEIEISDTDDSDLLL